MSEALPRAVISAWFTDIFPDDGAVRALWYGPGNAGLEGRVTAETPNAPTVLGLRVTSVSCE